MSLRKALQKCFEDEPAVVFSVPVLCETVKKYYQFSEFQEELDPKYPQPRYVHEIRSNLAKLKREGLINHIGRNQYRLA